VRTCLDDRRVCGQVSEAAEQSLATEGTEAVREHGLGNLPQLEKRKDGEQRQHKR
jgi:hypothetical protein